MSTSRIGAFFSGIALLGGLYLIGSSWEGFDGRYPAYTDPRVLAEGPAGDAPWAVLSVHERKSGDCLHLRRRGALVDRSCRELSMLADYRVQIHVLRGTSEPLLFGVLPEGTARAEIAMEPALLRGADPDLATAAVRVRAFGESGRYVAEPVPAGRRGTVPAPGESDSVTVVCYDGRGVRLTS